MRTSTLTSPSSSGSPTAKLTTPSNAACFFSEKSNPSSVCVLQEHPPGRVEDLLFVEHVGEGVEGVSLSDQSAVLVDRLRVREHVPDRVGDPVGHLGVADGGLDAHVDAVDHEPSPPAFGVAGSASATSSAFPSPSATPSTSRTRPRNAASVPVLSIRHRPVRAFRRGRVRSRGRRARGGPPDRSRTRRGRGRRAARRGSRRERGPPRA